MSSSETVLQNARSERPGEFTFTWFIHDYRYCTMESNTRYISPEFKVEFLWFRWFIELLLRGDEAPYFISCYLCNRGSGRCSTFNFTLSIRKSNGQFKEGNENIYSHSTGYNGHMKFLSIGELQGPNGYLVNGTLTLRCRMWTTDVDVDIPASIKWEAHSRIKVSKLDYTLIINGISFSNQASAKLLNKTDITDFFNNKTHIYLRVFKNGILGDGAIHFGIEMRKPKKNYFWIAVVHLIDTNGKVAHSARGEHLFGSSDETLVWNFPLISNETLWLNKLMYMPEGQLTLRCKLSFSAGNKSETFELRTTNKLDSESFTIDKQSDLHEVWIKNMQQCYEDKKFSDFIIRTPGQQYPVSRTLLSAHSEVFDAMFERDMKERKTGIVDIEDLDDDTVSKMLTYVYTSTFNSDNCSTAQNLYFAADKYGIKALRKMCSKYLMGCLDTSNVCDILELADTHQDEEMKSCARDFFRAHAKEIISSESWKNLREINSSLTTETMEWMICIS